MSGGTPVFVDQAAEDGFAVDPLAVDAGNGAAATVVFTVGYALGDALVWPGRVVMRLVFGQDGAQVALTEDQHAVEELSAQDTCTVHSPVGFAVTPPRCIRRVRCSINTRTYSLLRSTVSTCRKSTATIPAGWACRNCRQLRPVAVPDRCPQHIGSSPRWTARLSRRDSCVRRGCRGVPP